MHCTYQVPYCYGEKCFVGIPLADLGMQKTTSNPKAKVGIRLDTSQTFQHVCSSPTRLIMSEYCQARQWSDHLDLPIQLG